MTVCFCLTCKLDMVLATLLVNCMKTGMAAGIHGLFWSMFLSMLASNGLGVSKHKNSWSHCLQQRPTKSPLGKNYDLAFSE